MRLFEPIRERTHAVLPQLLLLVALGVTPRAWAAVPQDPDLMYIGGGETQRCETSWEVLRRAVESDYASGNWDLNTGRAGSTLQGGGMQRAGEPAPAAIRANGLSEIDRKIEQVRAGNAPADPSHCGAGGLGPPTALTTSAPRRGATRSGGPPTYDECQRLVRYRDGPLFDEWKRASVGTDVLADKLTLLHEARVQLVGDARLAASDWSGAAATLATSAKLVSDIILDMSGPAGAAARRAVAPLDALAAAVKAGRKGESGSQGALREVFMDQMIKDVIGSVRKWDFVAGGFANMAINARKMATTLDGWTKLREEYTRQLAALDGELSAADLALRSFRQEQAGLEDAKQRIDRELQECSLYR